MSAVPTNVGVFFGQVDKRQVMSQEKGVLREYFGRGK